MSVEFNETLISLVRENREIWDPKAPGHRNNERVKRLWEEMATVLNVSAELLKTRWKTLRDRFIKENKKVLVKITGSGGRRVCNRWPLLDQLQFLQATVEPRKTVTNYSSPTLVDLVGMDEEEIANEITILNDINDDDSEDTDDPPAQVSSQIQASSQGLSRQWTPSTSSSPLPALSGVNKRKRSQEDPLERQILKRLGATPREYTSEDLFYQAIAKDTVNLTMRGRLAVRQATMEALAREVERESMK